MGFVSCLLSCRSSVLTLIFQIHVGWLGYVILFLTDVCMVSLLISWKKMSCIDNTGFFVGKINFVVLSLKKLFYPMCFGVLFLFIP